MEKKRGQITVFIIIGIIVILSGFLIFYLMRSETIIDEPTLRPEVPVEATPVYNLVEQCMYDLTENALRIVMDKGGYITNDNLVHNPVYTTEGNALDLSPGMNFLIPKWFYLQSDNECTTNCQFSSMRKPLCKTSNTVCDYTGPNSIEEQIELYLKNNLNSCLNDFFEIERTGIDVNPLLEPEFNVYVRQNSLLVELEYPLEIIDQNQISEINEFRIQKQTALYELYETAYQIKKFQDEECMLEYHVLNLISLYSGVDAELPPFILDSFTTNIWIKTQIKNQLDLITNTFIPLLSLYNTSDRVFLDYPEGSFSRGISNSFIAFPFDEYKEVFVDFRMPIGFETYFRLDSPNQKGDIIIPRSDNFQNALTNFLGSDFFSYEDEFYYSYSFPVIVELRKFREDYTFENMEIFRFALEGNIRSNNCFRSSSGIATSISQESLLCNPLFFRNQETSFTILDDYTNEPLENVEIEFSAGPLCELGLTNSSGQINLNLPTAQEGILIFKKEGYLEKRIFDDDLFESNTIKLQPLFEVNVSTLLINEDLLNEFRTVSNWQNHRKQNAQNIKENMSIILQLEREKTSILDPEFSKFLNLNHDKEETIELTRGNYEVEIILFLEQNITLPEERNVFCLDTSWISFSTCRKEPINRSCLRPDYCFRYDYSINDYIFYPANSSVEELCNQILACSTWPTNHERDNLCFQITDCYIDGFTCSSACDSTTGEPIIYDEQNLSSIIQGGLIINETNSLWRVYDYDLLNNSDVVEFYIFDQGVPDRTTTMMNEITKYMDYSITYGNFLRPYFR